MDVDIADTEPCQFLPFDEMQDFLICRDTCPGQVFQGGQNDPVLPQMAKCQLSDNEGVQQDMAGFKQFRDRLIACPQMIHPDRCIEQDQAGSGRRREAIASSGSVPPNRASRRALSRSISALSASRTTAVFSVRPVNACALARRLSSRARVVRMIGFSNIHGTEYSIK
jgi:hypothetical protein